MSISPTTSYISPDTIDAWMQSKLEDAYTDMRHGMDTSGHRVDAEKALNQLKSELVQMKTNGADASKVTAEMHAAIDEFGEEFPDLKKGLEGFVKTLDEKAAAAADAASKSTWEQIGSDADGNAIYGEVPPTNCPAPVYLDSKQIDDWASGIGDLVDGLGKEDQLGTLNLNQQSAHISQTMNTASALMDSRNKTLDAIINRIG